ncbi:glycerol-3-phosphate acyltransferase [Oceanobacillus piezotolerans]|uniref:Glycerol-3-phosphate acyltransferase n=1 Tax=Oceanobacillus piezotolerans TaxID=2448030 RepID=A0A498D610_9BACI|nr:glycerol-3-phosphate acyltransferase [Oceanobacillus piezotolerans]RLL42095.1 glycerol-3-phosphate acyltransferase [Oceanobacillus piezotolerans]
MFFIMVSFIGYLFGCLHGSQLVGKLKNIDIKNSGVKNAGASNTTILLGWKYGILVAFIDIFKATLAILLVLYILKDNGLTGDSQMLLVYVTLFFVIIGHNYPITMKFSGGKGTASLVGALLAIDWKVALIGIGVLLIFTFATDYLVIGVLFMYISFLVTTYMFFGMEPAFVVFMLSILSFMKHMENYKRIITKQETKLSSMYKKKVS